MSIEDITHDLVRAIEKELYGKKNKKTCPYGFNLHEGRCFCCRECELRGML